MVVNFLFLYNPYQWSFSIEWFSVRDNFVSKGPFGISGDIFDCHDWGGVRIVYWYIEGKGQRIAKSPKRHRTASLTTTKNYPPPHFNCSGPMRKTTYYHQCSVKREIIPFLPTKANILTLPKHPHQCKNASDSQVCDKEYKNIIEWIFLAV